MYNTDSVSIDFVKMVDWTYLLPYKSRVEYATGEVGTGAAWDDGPFVTIGLTMAGHEVIMYRSGGFGKSSASSCRSCPSASMSLSHL